VADRRSANQDPDKNADLTTATGAARAHVGNVMTMTSARLFTATILFLVGVVVVVFVIFLAVPRPNRVVSFWIVNAHAAVGVVSVYDRGAKSIVDVVPFRISPKLAVKAFFGAGSCRAPGRGGQPVRLLDEKPFPAMMASKYRNFWGLVNATESQLEIEPHLAVLERASDGRLLGCGELTEKYRVVKL
jgi:hypothetical protein